MRTVHLRCILRHRTKDYEELQRLRDEKVKADVQAGFQSLERGEYGKLTIEEIKAEGLRRLESIENNVSG